MVKRLFDVIIGILLFTCLLGHTKADQSLLFPVAEPVYVHGKILCSAWYSYKRADMNGRSYQALNYPCREGSFLKCPGNGYIVDTGYQRYAGIYIKILLDSGLVIELNHLSNWAVVKGQRVTRGQMIGTSGRTGRTTGPHVRIVMYKNGEKTFCNAATWGMAYNQFMYQAGSSREELKFDFL